MKTLLRMVTLGMLVGFISGYATSCSTTTTANCPSGACPPSCSDGIQNAPETDVDCGGAICIECAVGLKCNIGADCLSTLCEAGRCVEKASAGCSNGAQDGTETDIDCGGSCTPCADGKLCSTGADCATGSCSGGRCVTPSCTDQKKNGTETDVDCGGSCAPCALTQGCSVDKDCAPYLCGGGKCGLGSGGDGPLAVPAAMTRTVNTVATAATGAKDGSTLTLASATGFAAGQVVFVHQTQGTGAGNHELNRIADLAGTTATLANPLRNTYAAGAQAVAVPQYTTVSVAATGTLLAPAWDGTKGGILVFQASGAVTIDGTVSMNGRGFRGGGDAINCYPMAPSCNVNHGRYGESMTGTSTFSVQDANGFGGNNGSGGGGGTRGQDCAAGGGGSYGTIGTTGATGTLGVCIVNGKHGGGLPGALAGMPDLNQTILLGGGGGEGGPDEDGTHPGPGGNGGGMIVIYADSLTVNGTTGSLVASGLDGGDGANVFALCGGGGAGMGNGGGGAGGAIRITTAGTTDLGSGRVSAAGGNGARAGSCGASYPGGAGGLGRIHVRAGSTVSGTTNPPAYAD